MNPILTGHVYEEKGQRELRIQPGTYKPETHEFVQIITAPYTCNFDDMNATEILQSVSDDFIPLFADCKLTAAQIKNKLPVYSATVVLLPGSSYALYSMEVSHAVGDGVTYFELVKQLSLIMSGASDIAPLQWDNPLKATHEIYPPGFSWRDVEISYGAPFMMGALKNVLTVRNRKAAMFLLNKNDIGTKKRELREKLGQNDISANDIITAALCRANGSSDIFVFTENIRGIVDGVPRNAAGNFFWEVPVAREVCIKPEELRKKVLSECKTDALDIMPFLCGRVGRVTSLATIATNVVYGETKIVCTVPFASFIKDIPLDVSVIFRFNRQYWGILHNFANFNMTGMLEDISP